MEYRRLGRLGLKVSALCLGTMNFGWEPYGANESQAFELMDRALDYGINLFDTANAYGWRGDGLERLGEGVTEQIIGRWLSQGGGRREKVVLATKVYMDMGSWPNEGGLSALHIKRACEASLSRLKCDYIDIYQMHHVARNTPWEEIWQAMEQLVREGKILYVGSCNFAGWHIVRANEAANQRHFLGIVSEQSYYNLLERTLELEVLPACEAYGIGVLPYGPLAGGLLAGNTSGAVRGRRSSREAQADLLRHGTRIESYESYCAEVGRAPADLALAWLLANPSVTAPIIGPRTVKQLDDAVRVVDGPRPHEHILSHLNDLFPGPGGAAPEAYAW